jgi:hypothetical protein
MAASNYQVDVVCCRSSSELPTRRCGRTSIQRLPPVGGDKNGWTTATVAGGGPWGRSESHRASGSNFTGQLKAKEVLLMQKASSYRRTGGGVGGWGGESYNKLKS